MTFHKRSNNALNVHSNYNKRLGLVLIRWSIFVTKREPLFLSKRSPEIRNQNCFLERPKSPSRAKQRPNLFQCPSTFVYPKDSLYDKAINLFKGKKSSSFFFSVSNFSWNCSNMEKR
jgi:hypothetical protein